MARGRTRKAGKREQNGRVQRGSAFDRGSDWVQSRKERFGEHYSTALGRAFAAGLLGPVDIAKVRYDAGKKFARLYTRVIGGDAYRCALNDSPRGRNAANDDPGLIERDLSEKAWLYDAGKKLKEAALRSYVDQLITSVNTDRGPHWLDALLEVLDWNKASPRERREFDPGDLMLLDAAIKGLDIIAPEIRPIGILSATY